MYGKLSKSTRRQSVASSPKFVCGHTHWVPVPLGGDLYEMCTMCHTKRYRDKAKRQASDQHQSGDDVAQMRLF